jgi:hypothetical protein
MKKAKKAPWKGSRKAGPVLDLEARESLDRQ